MDKEKYITTIDIGSKNIRTLIAKLGDEGPPRIVGIGVVSSGGIRRGVITEIMEVSQAIGKSVEMAELHSGVQADNVYVSINDSGLESINIKGVVAVGLADGEVVESDVKRVIEASQAINIPLNKEIIHIIPQNFKLDDQDIVSDPIGMSGMRLEMKGIAILGNSANIKNLIKCLEINELEIIGIIAVPIAVAQSALNKRQRELGVVAIELGAGVTSMIVYEEQKIIDVKVIPVGMGHITNDIAIGLRTSVEVAEEVKLKYGSSSPLEINKNDKINLAELDKGEEGVVSRRHVAEIIEARVEEILYLVKKELKKIDKDGLLPAGAVLSGGGSYIHGIVDLTKNILQLPAQIGFPAEVNGLVDKVESPSFNTSIGMLFWIISDDNMIKNFSDGDKMKITFIQDGWQLFKKWFRKFLP